MLGTGWVGFSGDLLRTNTIHCSALSGLRYPSWELMIYSTESLVLEQTSSLPESGKRSLYYLHVIHTLVEVMEGWYVY